MFHALGVSENDFNPADPGRLCRGRERWIEPWELPEDGEDVYRLVISGAAFTDDTAADALRGFVHSQLDMAEVIDTLLPGTKWMAFMEDGHPADIPQGAEGVELYPGHRAGGLSEEMLVRWYEVVEGAEGIRAVLGDPGEERIRGLVALPAEADREEVWQRIFLLVGMGSLDSPPSRYQPAALPELLEVVGAVVVLHRDKHGPALGIYARDPLALEGKLQPLCDRTSTLLVPFAIPPMLARWDRALHELREQWTDEGRGEAFPVPASGNVGGWEPRWRRRQRNRDDADARREMQGDEDGDYGPEGEEDFEGTPIEEADEAPPPLDDLGDIDDLLSIEDDEPRQDAAAADAGDEGDDDDAAADDAGDDDDPFADDALLPADED